MPAGRRRRVALVAAALLLLAAAYDLFGPWRADFRRIDPARTARLETDMWRSYYERRPVALFWQLGQFLRSEYHLPPLRSMLVAAHASRAAFTFKKGSSRRDYELALPRLDRYFAALERAGGLGVDPKQMSLIELEWWIVHRERTQHPREDLDRALAEAAAAFYGVPADETLEHGRLRAEAMLLRDERAEQGGVREEDWRRIEDLLVQSFTSLAAALARTGSHPRPAGR